jgi:hypothetical protein
VTLSHKWWARCRELLEAKAFSAERAGAFGAGLVVSGVCGCAEP